MRETTVLEAFADLVELAGKILACLTYLVIERREHQQEKDRIRNNFRLIKDTVEFIESRLELWLEQYPDREGGYETEAKVNTPMPPDNNVRAK